MKPRSRNSKGIEKSPNEHTSSGAEPERFMSRISSAFARHINNTLTKSIVHTFSLAKMY